MYIAEYILNVLLLVVFVWVCLFLTTLAHEAGHVVTYRILFRDKNWRIAVGSGKAIAKFKRFTFGIIPVFGAYTGEYKHQGGSKFQHIMVYLGGPLANLLFIVLLVLLKVSLPESINPNYTWFLGFTFWANVFQLANSLIPMKYSYHPFPGAISDGKRIMNKIAEKEKEPSALP